jgi:hypothetical protein
MYTDPIKPKAYPDLLQKTDYDPFGLMPAVFPDHPRILTTADRLDAMRKAIARGGLAKRMFETLCKRLPIQDPNPAASPSQKAALFASRAVRASLILRLGGKPAHRKMAVDALQNCVAFWPALQGAFQGEPEMVRQAAAAFDLLQEVGLPAATHTALREAFYGIYPLLFTRAHLTCNNHNVFMLLSRLSVATALGDRKGFHEALYGLEENGKWRYGLIHTLRHDILDDGMQWEGCMGYHLLVLMALAECATILENLGLDIWHRPFPSLYQDDGHDEHRGYGKPGATKTFKSAFDVFFYQAFPNGDYSKIHDQILGNIRGSWVWWPLFQKAWQVYKDPKYAWLLTKMQADYAKHNGPLDRLINLSTERGDLDFVRFDLKPVPPGRFSYDDDATWGAAGVHRRGCSLFPVNGSTILRATPTRETSPAVNLYWGPHWSGHRSPGALHIDIVTGSQALTEAPHITQGGYEDPVHLTWNRTTIAHNTVTVDEQPMFPFDFDTQSLWETDTWRDHLSDSELISFQPEKSFKRVRVANRQVYPGVCLDRSLLLTADYLVDVFRVSSDQPHQYDWALHALGLLKTTPTGEPIQLGNQRGYRHFTQAETLKTRPGWISLTFVKGGSPYVLSLYAPPKHQTILASDPVPDGRTPIGEFEKPQPRTTLIRRVHGKTAVFLAVWNFNPRRPLRLQAPRINPAGLQLNLGLSRGPGTRWFFPV